MSKIKLHQDTIDATKNLTSQTVEQVSVVWFEDGTMSLTGNQGRCLQVTRALNAIDRMQGVDLVGLNETIERYRNGHNMEALDNARLINAAQTLADIIKLTNERNQNDKI